MLFGKYINKYYLKYAILFIIGIAALIAVDVIQTFIPEYLGEVVKIITENSDANNVLGDADRNRIFMLGLYVLLVAGGMFLGRFIWRITL